jgi:hypothetical protein
MCACLDEGNRHQGIYGWMDLTRLVRQLGFKSRGEMFSARSIIRGDL